jgi:glycosyltransferase involved in cell wall biosynthesis
MMKIAVIAPTFLPARRANTVQVMKMTQAFQDLGHEVHLAVPKELAPSYRQKKTLPASWNELRQHYGLHSRFPIEWLPARPQLRRYDFGWRAFHWARRLGADLIYTRLPQAAALSSQMGFPTILEVHDRLSGQAGPWLFRRFLNGGGARRLVVITHALGQDLKQSFNFPANPHFLVIAPDGVDLIRYQNLPEPLAARRNLALPASPANWPERFTAGYTGHLYPGRGAELLLEIAALEPEIHFLLAGGEPADVERLLALAKTRGLTNLVLSGFILNADLPQYQAACETLLMPYQRQVEASSGGDIARYLSPMKLFEYLACGRAIISSDLPVLREVLNENNAILLPPDDSQAWAQALRALKTDPARLRRLAEQARQDAQKYSWTARVQHILSGL